MKKSIKIIALMLLFSGTLTYSPALNMFPNPALLRAGDDLTVTVLSSTSAAISWMAADNENEFTVEIENLTKGILEQQFTTSSTSVTVNNLTSGDAYLFTVKPKPTQGRKHKTWLTSNFRF